MTARTWLGTLVLCGMAAATQCALAQDYSWQRPQARVLPQGDLEWAPEPFVFEKGNSVRYIDFEGGDDGNDGLTRSTPWKHHPWDADATGRAGECSGIHTYVFKQGVAYRGKLTAKESGEPGNPIRLTRDPDWGEGEAAVYGSVRIAGGWKRCTAADIPRHMPEPQKVWHLNLGADWTPHALWELRGEEVVRIPIARDPNWTVSSPDDPQSEWYEWTARIKGKGSVDAVHLTQDAPSFFDGGYVWTEWSGNMGTIHIAAVQGYDPQQHLLRAGNGSKGNRYYVENVAGFLDSPGEYYHAVQGEHAGRLYVRLPDDRDPNGAVLEASRVKWPVEIKDQSHVAISGLRFSFNDVGEPGTGWPPIWADPAAVRIAGNCQDVTVSHCRFHHVMAAVTAFPRMNRKFSEIYMTDLLPWRADVMDGIVIADNDIAFSDRSAVQVRQGQMLTRIEYPPYGELKRVDVMRNRLYYVGNRPGGNMYTAIPAISVLFPERCEIAGNIVDTCWGSGIFTFGGKASGEVGEAPLTRIVVHHNKITNAMLACNDYGGLEAWQGGSNYLYNNISGNSIGYRHYADLKNDWKTVAYNVYLDGTFKSYLFNNIIWGKSNDTGYPYRNRGAYFVVLGFMNHFFNNTIYRFRHGIVGSSGNRSSYLGNIVADVSGSFIQQNREGDTSLRGGGDTGEMGNRGVPTDAYGNNVFCGKAAMGNVGRIRGDTLEALRAALEQLPARLSQLGWHTENIPLRDPDRHDFRIAPGSAPVDRGVKFFVPWSLYAMAGEWNFCEHPANPEVVLGEGFYMTEEYIDRHQYDLIPRNDLGVPGATLEDYVRGPLEDWTDGVLLFNGADRYCVLPHADIVGDAVYSVGVPEGSEQLGKGRFTFPGRERKGLNIDTCNLLIEVCLKTHPGHTGGVIVSKAAEAGYVLDLDAQGRPRLTLRAAGRELCSRTGSAPVNDGEWHHVIAELDRETTEGITLYVDGKQANGAWSGRTPSGRLSLSNDADFLVGKGPEGGYFAGAMDFLRVARGTLADAKTTIEELYEWEFNGPFMRDFCGNTPAGKRDAGAIEGR